MFIMEPNNDDPVFFHMPYGGYTVNVDVQKDFTSEEKAVLRDLARRQATAAALPEQDRKRKLWTAHNDLKTKEPVVLCDPEGGWNEIIAADTLRCTTPLARIWEMRLRKDVFWGESMGDHKVVDDIIFVPYAYTSNSMGMPFRKIGDGRDGHAYNFDRQIEDYERDLPKLKPYEITIFEEKTKRVADLAHDVFDGILRVELRGLWWWSFGYTHEFIMLRKLDNFMLDFYDNPEWLHKAMAVYRDSSLRFLDFLESRSLLSSNVGNVYIGSGGFGFTDELPHSTHDNSRRVKTSEMWGFSESQETSGVSEEFFQEFILAYQMPVLERFGLNYYGCCEALDQRMDSILKIPRLRRLSSSAWANLRAMSERLGDRYVMACKPNPSIISRPKLDEQLVRKQIRDILEQTRGSVVELVMKDNHTLGGRGQNAVDWCRIAREEIANFGF